MKLTELVNIIESNGKGVGAYVECHRACRDQLATQSDNALSYFLLMFAAGRFADTYDDQPLTSPKAEEEFLNFKSYVAQLEAVENETTPDNKIAALNRITAEIANHKLMRSSV